jgi:hypothetical protein
MNMNTNFHADIRTLDEVDLDVVAGGESWAEGEARFSASKGGMTAVVGMYGITNYVLGLADGAKGKT